MICLKIRTFVVSATTNARALDIRARLWFAWKFVPLWYQQQHAGPTASKSLRCDLLENSYLCGISNNKLYSVLFNFMLWFAWKFVPLWYQQQLRTLSVFSIFSCDLLENSYLCGISNNLARIVRFRQGLWFAWKFVPLWYQQQLSFNVLSSWECCDLLENSYLCGISNNDTL